MHLLKKHCYFMDISRKERGMAGLYISGLDS